uniref:Uncharacterized protein n=1 Tax=Oryza barthii TaxID=65489 RepID=A0A0D3FD02_9ORYZ
MDLLELRNTRRP